MTRAIKASITFGLVYIPVSLSSCIKNNNISFHLIDKKTMSRIKYLKTCSECEGKIVDSKNIVKGFEYEKGKYVIIDDVDFKKLQTKKDKNIIIEQFVNLKEIDPIFFDKSFYVTPEGGEKAFNLLVKALEEEKKVGIAKMILNNKEYLVSLRTKDKGIILNTLFFSNQIQKNPFIPTKEIPNAKEIKLAKAIISDMSEKFDISKFKDTYKEQLMSVIEKKISGKKIVKAKEKNTPKINNLLDALQASIKASEKRKKSSYNKQA